MPRLSIVVFCFARTDLLEETLVTVLQHRPADSEVVVVHDGRYTDPYELGDEVRFLVVEPGTSLVECANLGWRNAEGQIIHYMAGGVKVDGDWTASSVGYFDDPQVGAVTPVLMDSRDDDTIVCVGIRPSRLLNRVLIANGRSGQRVSLTRLGSGRFRRAVPNLVASFYRRTHLESLGGFRTDFGDELADLDLGLRLESVAAESVIDIDCQIIVSETDLPRRNSAIRRGRAHQRFVAAHRNLLGMLSVSAVAGLNGLMEVLTSPRAPSRLLSAWGRFAEWRAGSSAPEAATDAESARTPLLSIDGARREKAAAAAARQAESDRRAA